MNDLGKFLVVLGVVLAGVGLLLWSGIGRSWIGRLPGDIHVSGEKFSFHFPIVTFVLLSGLFWLLRRL